MRAREFMDETQTRKVRRILLPTTEPKIEVRKKQYELLKKRAEWLNKVAELKSKLTTEAGKNSRTVKGMANNALKHRQVGVYGHRGD